MVTALAERDALVLACEARAGEALRTLTDQEGLSMREAVAWCGGDEQLTVREATRLRRVEAAPGEPASEPAEAAADEQVGGESARPAGSGEDVVSSAAAGEGRGAPR